MSYPFIVRGAQIELPRKVFDAKGFIPPERSALALVRKTAIRAWEPLPLCMAHIDTPGKIDKARYVDQAADVVDVGKLRVVTSDGRSMLIADVRDVAKQAAPEGLGLNASFDWYARTHFNKSYSDLVADARRAVIGRFMPAFRKCVPYEIPEFAQWMESLYAISADSETIAELKELAGQGHVYAQYLVGVILSSKGRGYDLECVDYLLMAYQNKQPEALTRLGWVLLRSGNYLGAIQCALISSDCGGDRTADRQIIEVARMNAQGQMSRSEHGVQPVWPFIQNTLMSSPYAPLLEKYIGHHSHRENVNSW